MAERELRFRGRVAVVTGAGRGIGREQAILLASLGARVIVNDLGVDVDGEGPSSRAAQDVVAEIHAAGGEAVANFDTVASWNGAEQIIQAALDSYGRLDVLINNAAVFKQRNFIDLTPEDLAQMMEVNALGTMYVAKAAWPHMVNAQYGRVVNTASGAIFGVEQLCGYSASKGAVLCFTNSLALEGKQYGIRVNALAPAAATRLVLEVSARHWPAERVDEMRPLHPRFVGPVTAYLSHEECNFTGQTISVAGGSVGEMGLHSVPMFDQGEPTLETVAAAFDAKAPQLNPLTR